MNEPPKDMEEMYHDCRDAAPARHKTALRNVLAALVLSKERIEFFHDHDEPGHPERRPASTYATPPCPQACQMRQLENQIAAAITEIKALIGGE